jgi:hypothetical protein
LNSFQTIREAIHTLSQVKSIGFTKDRGVKVTDVGANNKDSFRIHLGLFLAELICIPAFLFELKRAIGGNTLSWAYVVEWPLLGGYANYMWRKLLHEARGEVKARPAVVEEQDDPQLMAWNEYLAELHAPTKSTQTDDPENLAD